MEKQQGTRPEIIFNRVMEATAWISCALMVIMMLFIMYDVVLRYLLRWQSGWITDFISFYLLIYITLLPAGWILLEGGHVSVDIVASLLGRKKRHYLNLLTNIIGLMYSVVLTWQGWLLTWREFTRGTAFPVASWLPVWPAVIVIFLGGVLLCLAFVMKIAVQLWLHKPTLSHGDRLDYDDRLLKL